MCIRDRSNPAQSVCFLKKKCEWFTVADVQPNWIHWKVLELALNYHQRMIRYAFRIPPKIGNDGQQLEDGEGLRKCRRYIETWLNLIIQEKQRQMQLPDDFWPPWPTRSEVASVYDMPTVMWLSRESPVVVAPSDVIIPVV